MPNIAVEIIEHDAGYTTFRALVRYGEIQKVIQTPIGNLFIQAARQKLADMISDMIHSPDLTGDIEAVLTELAHDKIEGKNTQLRTITIPEDKTERKNHA